MSTAAPPTSSGDKSLALVEDDLTIILREMEGVASEWYGIGLELGVSNSKLECISKEPGNIKDMFRKMISEWLKKNYDTEKFGQPTWGRIVEAVRAGPGGRNSALANQLASNHGVIQDTQPSGGGFTISVPRYQEAQCKSTCCCCCYPTRTGNDQVEDTPPTQSNPQMYERPQANGTQQTNEPPREDMTLPQRSSRKESIPQSVKSKKFSQTYPNPGSVVEESTIMESLKESKDPILAHPDWEIKDLTKQDGYFGILSTQKAEENLRRCGGNCYLIRYSKGNKRYVISVMRHDAQHLVPAITHYTLLITKEDDHSVYEIEGTEKPFTDINLLLQYYQEKPITRSECTIGKACKIVAF